MTMRNAPASDAEPVRWRRALARGLLALAAVLPLALAAQGLPLPLPAKSADTTPAAPAESFERQRSRLVAEIDHAHATRDRLASDAAAAAVPASLPPEELAAARNTMSQWVLSLEGLLRSFDELQLARETRKQAEKAETEWQGFPSPPPYSILLVDDLNNQFEATRTRISALTAQRLIAMPESERARTSAQRSEAALRLARESLATTGAGERSLAQWRAQAADWAAAAANAQLALLQRSLEVIDTQIAAEQSQLRLLERKRETATREARFSAEDLADVKRQQEQRLERLRTRRAKVAEGSGRSERELAAATSALRLAEADPAATEESLQLPRARLRAAQAAAESVRFELVAVDSLTAIAGATADLYAQRFQALNDGSAERRREAAQRLREVRLRLSPWRDFAQSQLDLLRSEERGSMVRADGVDLPAPVQAYEMSASESIRQRAASAQRLFDAADNAERTVIRWLAEIDASQQTRPLADRVAGALATAREWAQWLWNFELFAVEDTVDVAGQKITTSRGVTIGKSVGAALLFVIGYWMATLVARRFEGLLIARFAIEPAQARTVRRWVLALWGFVLVVLTLNLARIPLTVFAFLGGALAIGVGFGTQTIIRNFISGLIVLMERQVRVGDTIEVDGVTGTVTEINLRSSTVRAFDGVEAIVPNSDLLENRVTNWTHSDLRVRRTVKVGVAYGSPVRQVADLLTECLHRHGLVLKEPAPLVLLEDFGDSALVFAMFFWLEMKPGVNSSLVMSDLRFMVHKALEEAGISLPFPQRDVHLNASRPLQVQIARPGPVGG